jgi:hypothetical protein
MPILADDHVVVHGNAERLRYCLEFTKQNKHLGVPLIARF